MVQFCSGCKNLNNQAMSDGPKILDTKAFISALEANLASSSRRVSGKLVFSLSSLVYHLYGLCKWRLTSAKCCKTFTLPLWLFFFFFFKSSKKWKVLKNVTMFFSWYNNILPYFFSLHFFFLFFLTINTAAFLFFFFPRLLHYQLCPMFYIFLFLTLDCLLSSCIMGYNNIPSFSQPIIKVLMYFSFAIFFLFYSFFHSPGKKKK